MSFCSSVLCVTEDGTDEHSPSDDQLANLLGQGLRGDYASWLPKLERQMRRGIHHHHERMKTGYWEDFIFNFTITRPDAMNSKISRLGKMGCAKTAWGARKKVCYQQTNWRPDRVEYGAARPNSKKENRNLMNLPLQLWCSRSRY